MTNANKFNPLLDVVKLMHSLADGLEAVALRICRQSGNLRRSQGSVAACRNRTTHKADSRKDAYFGRCPCRACG